MITVNKKNYGIFVIYSKSYIVTKFTNYYVTIISLKKLNGTQIQKNESSKLAGINYNR